MNSDTTSGGLTEGAHASVPTRGFLFADLRGYTEFVEHHGAVAAADLLDRYRELVRRVIARFDGAEIRTEGDSFYIVFQSVSQAVRSGLAVVDEAAEASADRPERPIRVGVGIHAGETVETADGFVGASVNIAARLCALAGAGEVLVSDTVRALTQTVLSVRFESRGRKQLKGVAEPVAVYSVQPLDGEHNRSARRLRRFRRRHLLLLATAGVVLAAVVVGGAAALRHRSGLPSGPWKIGLDMPLSGSAQSRGIPVRNAVQLALDQANASGGVAGSRLMLVARDDSGADPNGQSPTRGAANTRVFVSDPRVIAMIGPWGSNVAWKEIPISNAAGLLQCSPATTDPSLTKPRGGALDLRAAAPERINYIRTAPADDIQAQAAASFLFDDLGVRHLLVIDDSDYGREAADSVSESFMKLGGTVTQRALNPGADARAVLQPLTTGADRPTGVYFGGFANTGAPQVRRAMVADGFGKLPFVSWDGIGGPGSERGSFIQLAGHAAVGAYQSHASIAPSRASFGDAYRSKFGSEPDEYAASAYACTEVIIAALRAVAASGASGAGLREALRSEAVDPSHRYATVLGSIGFDANGDSSQQFVTFYRVDPTADGGKGDWVIEKEQDYGPAP